MGDGAASEASVRMPILHPGALALFTLSILHKTVQNHNK